MKLLIAVTHLLGTGHLSRALTLGRAFGAAGHQVFLISGGMPAPQLNHDGLNTLNLPPLRSDGVDFTRLLDENGQAATPEYLSARTAALCTALRQFEPDIIITELFPFGRRILSAEFTAFLDTAATLPKAPMILSSIRDILAPPSKPAKAEKAEQIIAQHYSGVLVHSDPALTPLEVSWPITPALRAKLHYTGYVAPPPSGPHPEGAGHGEVLVSAGGGSVGTPIYRAALGAAALTPDLYWRLLVGGKDAAERIASLRGAHNLANVALEKARPDFRQMLYHAAASVSMCGYNTALDLLQAGTPSVLVPFDDGNEVEQGLRAESLAREPAMEVLRSGELSPEALAASVRQVARQPRQTGSTGQFDGATRSVEIVETLLGSEP
ncbi:glycosyltransferase [Ruegeria sp. 2205SS24-7]|uniref:glycosyltransferase family protein n=1 Tax=Ruegeria discodermiae TaxID=3064389 RepID=UPI0027416430|nr:glycosyltransferase [Ruegeria sp. 2205SS24-7]MDP5218612.1 glycosyltransferase [Ruegeria sp. 2205SS24-7]